MLEIVGSFLFKKKEVLLQLSDVIFQNLYLGRCRSAGVPMCSWAGVSDGNWGCAGLIFCLALYFRIFLNLLNLLFKVSEVPLEFIEAGFWSLDHDCAIVVKVHSQLRVVVSFQGELSTFADASFPHTCHVRAEDGVPGWWVFSKEEQLTPDSVVIWSTVVRLQHLWVLFQDHFFRPFLVFHRFNFCWVYYLQLLFIFEKCLRFRPILFSTELTATEC